MPQIEALCGLLIEPLLGIGIAIVDPGNHFVNLILHRT